MADPKEVHSHDQLAAAIAHTAHLTATFYKTLIADGVPEYVALSLTATFTQELIDNGRRSNDGDTGGTPG